MSLRMGVTAWVTVLAASSSSFAGPQLRWVARWGEEPLVHERAITQVGFAAQVPLAFSIGSYSAGARVFEVPSGHTRLFVPNDMSLPMDPHGALGPDGRYFFASTFGGVVRMFDTTTGLLMREMPADGGARALRTLPNSSGRRASQGSIPEISALAVSRDGEVLLAGDTALGLRAWEPTSGRLLWSQTEDRATGKVTSIAFLPDGKTAFVTRLVTTSTSEEAQTSPRIVDLATGATVAVPGKRAAAAFVSSDGEFAATGSSLLQLWRAPGWTEIKSWPIAKSGLALDVLALSRGGSRVFGASSSESGSIVEVDATSGERVATLHGHHGTVTALALSPDDRYLLSGGADGTARIWDASRGAEVRVGPAQLGSITTLTTLRGHVWSAASDGALDEWNPDGTIVRTVDGPGVFATTFSPADDRMVFAQKTGLSCRDITSGQTVWERPLDLDWVSTVAWSSRDEILLAAANRVFVYDAKNGQPLRHFVLPANIGPISWSEAGTRIAWSSHEGHLGILEADTGWQLRSLAGHRGPSYTSSGYGPPRFEPHGLRKPDVIVWSPDGERLATATDLDLKVWDTRSGDLVWSAPTTSAGRSVGIALACAPGGDRLVTGDSRGIVKLYDAAHGQVIASLDLRKTGARFHESSIDLITFLPDGRHLVAGTRGGSLFELEIASK